MRIGTKRKLKLLKILELLRDADGGEMTTRELCNYLNCFDIPCDRRTLAEDIELLVKEGYPIGSKLREHEKVYYIYDLGLSHQLKDIFNHVDMPLNIKYTVLSHLAKWADEKWPDEAFLFYEIDGQLTDHWPEHGGEGGGRLGCKSSKYFWNEVNIMRNYGYYDSLEDGVMEYLHLVYTKDDFILDEDIRPLEKEFKPYKKDKESIKLLFHLRLIRHDLRKEKGCILFEFDVKIELDWKKSGIDIQTMKTKRNKAIKYDLRSLTKHEVDAVKKCCPVEFNQGKIPAINREYGNTGRYISVVDILDMVDERTDGKISAKNPFLEKMVREYIEGKTQAAYECIYETYKMVENKHIAFLPGCKTEEDCLTMFRDCYKGEYTGQKVIFERLTYGCVVFF